MRLYSNYMPSFLHYVLICVLSGCLQYVLQYRILQLLNVYYCGGYCVQKAPVRACHAFRKAFHLLMKWGSHCWLDIIITSVLSVSISLPHLFLHHSKAMKMFGRLFLKKYHPANYSRIHRQPCNAFTLQRGPGSILGVLMLLLQNSTSN